MATTLQQAIEAIKAGDSQEGKALLTELLRRNPRSEAAWLWMAYVVDSSVQRRECLARVLTINPNNENAWRGLSQLNRLPPAKPALSNTPRRSDSVSPAAEAAAAAPLPPSDTQDRLPQAETTTGRSDRFWFWWVILFLVVSGGIVIGANLVNRWSYWLQFARAGVTSYATVTDARVAADGGYLTAYQFETPLLSGKIKRIEKEEQVSQALYEQLAPGSLVRVQYLFDRPSTVHIQGRDRFDDLLYWTTLALLAAVAAALPGLIGVGSGFRRGWGLVSGFRPSFKRVPPKPKVVWEGEGPPPLKRWTGTYTLGQNNYEGFFIIETEDGTFLGEGGMEVFKTVPDSDPQQVIAFDVGLFDKTDITTLSRILLSEEAYQDETILAAIEANPHAEPILAKPGAAFTMESNAMRIEARIDDMAYADEDTLYFDKLTVSLDIFVKEGIDLEQPMEIPDQFKEEA